MNRWKIAALMIGVAIGFGLAAASTAQASPQQVGPVLAAVSPADYLMDYADVQETRSTENGNYTTRWRANVYSDTDLCGGFFGNFSGSTKKYRMQHHDTFNDVVLHQSSLQTLANGDSGSWVDWDGYYDALVHAQVRIKVYTGGGTYIGTSIMDPYEPVPGKTHTEYTWKSQNWAGCS